MKKISLATFVVVALLGIFTLSAFSQSNRQVVVKEKKFDVEIAKENAISAQGAQIEKLVVRENKELREVFQLSFSIPLQSENLIQNSRIYLTAYNEGGAPLGMHVWKLSPAREEISKSDSSLVFNLPVNTEFEKAARFSLSIKEDPANLVTSCTDCVNLANDTCGRGRVASVKCGRTRDSETCEFTCKPN